MGICAFCAFALIAGSQYESLIVQQQTILKIAEWAVGRGGWGGLQGKGVEETTHLYSFFEAFDFHESKKREGF